MNKLTITLLATLFILGACFDSDWKLVRKADSDTNITFGILLKQNNTDMLNQMLDTISDPDSKMYGNYMTLEEIGMIVGIDYETKMELDIVNKYLGFNCSFMYDAYLCTASIQTVNKVFNVNMCIYENSQGKKLIRSNIDYVVPIEYGNYGSSIDFIEGLSNNLFPIVNPKTVKTTDISVDPRYVGQESVNLMYNIGGVAGNSNITVAAWEFMEGGFLQNYVIDSQLGNGVSPRNVTILVGPNGSNDIETELDLDEIANFGGINVGYGESNGWIVMGALQIQHLNASVRPNVVSISYGWSVYDQCTVVTCNNITSQQYVARADNELKKLGLLGVSVLVSSGDAGSKGRTDEGCTTNRLDPDYPGSSPYVTSVGATFNTQCSNEYNFTTSLCVNDSCSTCFANATVPVSFDYVEWTTGGGFAAQNFQSWQVGFTDEYLKSGVYLPNSSWNELGRGYPDVVMNGHNCPTYGVYGAGFAKIDGTSCSSPMFAGLVGLLNSHQLAKNRPMLGFLNPLLYKLASNYPAVFTPSAAGYTYCTEDMCCTPDEGFQTPPHSTKWNPVFGLGQPNFMKLIAALDDMFEMH
jgi:tripeptidyl-peptidase-1